MLPLLPDENKSLVDLSFRFSIVMTSRENDHRMSKRTPKNRFFSKRLKIKQNTAKSGADFLMNFDSRSG